jgi:hypothetical protein
MCTRRHLGALTGVLILLLLSAGCGKSAVRPRLQGQVTFQDQGIGPLTLTLYSEGGPGEFFTHKVPVSADGTFAGEAPTPGMYRVVFEESLAAQEGNRAAGPLQKVPLKYRAIATTDLEWIIQDGENSREFKLE